MDLIDLHVHTTASDGTLRPAQAVRLAAELGLRAIAVTDHDTVSGCREAEDAGRALGLETVSGIELSTRWGVTVHILGYFLDLDSPKLRKTLDWIIEERNDRNRQMVSRMAEDGIPIEYDALRARFGEAIGRPNIGQVLVELGLASSVQDAFDRYIEKGQPYYFSRKMLEPARCIETIREAGGVPVLAHPFQYRFDDRKLRELIELGMDCGLGGLECLYSGYSEEQSAYLLALAAEYGLCPTGGSDFHGANKPQIRLGSGKGALRVPYAYLERLREFRSCPRESFRAV